MKNKLYSTMILTLLCSSLFAQQDPMYSQYMFNGLALNPAYAGSHEGLSMTALLRQQWVSLEGAPSTQTFSIHTPIPKQRAAVGLMIVNDQLGVTRQTGLNLSYAYRIKFKKGGTLSMGLQASLMNVSSEFSKLKVRDLNDINFTSDDVQSFLPNFGVGLYYYTKRFYLGVAMPRLRDNAYSTNTSGSSAKQAKHYFIYSGLVFELTHALKLKPNFLLKIVEGAPIQLDMNANLLIKEIIWLGMSYRSFDSFSAILEMQLTDNLKVGYSYDFKTLTDLKKVQFGSHEIMLSYKLPYSKAKVITPRYF
ncbi:MAG: type IX secretion system membrane protein PorP/SprF [Bacteroidetes bacterium]|nr:MAG: type IX secretion system membrane protein PorP/SprF [Bacteroidota bacterium]